MRGYRRVGIVVDYFDGNIEIGVVVGNGDGAFQGEAIVLLALDHYGGGFRNETLIPTYDIAALIPYVGSGVLIVITLHEDSLELGHIYLNKNA